MARQHAIQISINHYSYFTDRFGLIFLPLRLMTGSSDVAIVVIDSFGFTIGVVFSTEAFRGILLTAAFGVAGIVFGVTLGLGSDFILTELLGYNIIEMVSCCEC